MNPLFRPFALIALCLALVGGSVTMAVARGNATALSRGGITLVLCSGLGYRTISLDAGGNPIGPLHPCPDCLTGLSAYLAPATSHLGQRIVLAYKDKQPVPKMPRLQIVADVPRARGPPLVV